MAVNAGCRNAGRHANTQQEGLRSRCWLPEGTGTLSHVDAFRMKVVGRAPESYLAGHSTVLGIFSGATLPPQVLLAETV